MEDVTEEMSVVELADQSSLDIGRQGFEPLGGVARQGDVERDDLADVVGIDRAASDRSPGDREPVQHRQLRLARLALEHRAAPGGEQFVQQGAVIVTGGR
ncbi:hypothetical protein D3C72_1990940 [compost metagenome]